MSTFEMNKDSFKIGNCLEIHFYSFSKKYLKFLLIADRLKNKVALKSLLTPKIKTQGLIRLENILL